jgi:hypothetical protein
VPDGLPSAGRVPESFGVLRAVVLQALPLELQAEQLVRPLVVPRRDHPLLIVHPQSVTRAPDGAARENERRLPHAAARHIRRTMPGMRILDEKQDRALDSVTIYLTPDEARQLADAT